MNDNLLIKIVFFGITGTVLLWNTFLVIPTGHRGVVFDTLRGGVQKQVMSEGLHMKVPFVQYVRKLPVNTQKVIFGSNTKESDFASMKAASSDLQDVIISVTVTYHLDHVNIYKIYQDLGGDYVSKKIVPNAIDAVKTYTAKYKVQDILTKREEIKELVYNDLKSALAKDNIVLEDINLTDITFDEQFKKSIEEKQIAEQQAQKEKYLLDQKQVQYQAKIAEAEANKQAKILEGEGIAAYNKAVQINLNPSVIEYKRLENNKFAIDKWNGTYPQTYLGGNGSSIPLINIKE